MRSSATVWHGPHGDLQVPLDFLVVNCDVFGLLAFKLDLLESVLLCSQLLESTLQIYIIISLPLPIYTPFLYEAVPTVASSSSFRAWASADCAPPAASAFIRWCSRSRSSSCCCFVWVVCFWALRRFILDSTFWSCIVKASLTHKNDKQCWDVMHGKRINANTPTWKKPQINYSDSLSPSLTYCGRLPSPHLFY